MRLPLDEIDVGERIRSDLGDLSDLKESIKTVGLLHPIVVTKAGSLVAGERRLTAVRELGWTDVPVTVADDLKDAATFLRAEADENTARKPFTPYEASRFRERQAELLKPLAEERKAATKAKPGERVGVGASKLDEPTGATRKLAAAGTGYSGSTLDKVDKIRDAAERGVVRVGKSEVPVPDSVRLVANEALSEVKQTGAAIDSASKKVTKALDDYLDTPERRKDLMRLALAKAITKATELTSAFDPTIAGELMDDETEQIYLLTQRLVNKWFDTALAARPRGLKIVGK